MYELPEDIKMLRELAIEFTAREIIPRAEHYDQSDEWPWDIFQKAREVGLVRDHKFKSLGFLQQIL